MRRLSRLPPLLLVIAIIPMTVSPLGAAVESQGQVFEVWFENYSPGASEFDSDLAYGIRFAYNSSERVTFAGEIGYVSLSGEFSDATSTVEVDYSSWFVDLVTDINFAAGSKVVPALFVGAGYAVQSADAKRTGPLVSVSVEGLDDGGLTLQGGGALKIQLGKKFELRPGVRVRWFEQRTEDDLDTEYLLGFGFRF